MIFLTPCLFHKPSSGYDECLRRQPGGPIHNSAGRGLNIFNLEKSLENQTTKCCRHRVFPKGPAFCLSSWWGSNPPWSCVTSWPCWLLSLLWFLGFGGFLSCLASVALLASLAFVAACVAFFPCSAWLALRPPPQPPPALCFQSHLATV